MHDFKTYYIKIHENPPLEVGQWLLGPHLSHCNLLICFGSISLLVMFSVALPTTINYKPLISLKMWFSFEELILYVRGG